MKTLTYVYGIPKREAVEAILTKFVVVESIKKRGALKRLYLVNKPPGLEFYKTLRIIGRKTVEIEHAGIKDTVAHAYFYIASQEKLPDKIHKIKLFHVGYTNELGPQLNKGNYFRVEIEIKNIDKSRLQKISNTLCNLPNSFFIPNYYGPQRFGVSRPVNSVLGKILKAGESYYAWYYLGSLYKTRRTLPRQEQYYFDLARKYMDLTPKIRKEVKELIIESFTSYFFNRILDYAGLKPSIYYESNIPQELEERTVDCLNKTRKSFHFPKKTVTRLIDKVMEEEGVKPRTSLFYRRPAIVPVCGYSCRKSGDKHIFLFGLPSGAYATILLYSLGVIIKYL